MIDLLGSLSAPAMPQDQVANVLGEPKQHEEVQIEVEPVKPKPEIDLASKFLSGLTAKPQEEVKAE